MWQWTWSRRYWTALTKFADRVLRTFQPNLQGRKGWLKFSLQWKGFIDESLTEKQILIHIAMHLSYRARRMRWKPYNPPSCSIAASVFLCQYGKHWSEPDVCLNKTWSPTEKFSTRNSVYSHINWPWIATQMLSIRGPWMVQHFNSGWLLPFKGHGWLMANSKAPTCMVHG
jgi:hypothetical protein